MAAANSQYHIVLNGQGYILHEETYRRKAQPSRHPRFSTGDDALTDLSFWQFFSQTQFDGGQGQDAFTSLNKIRGSVGWDFRDGKPRLSLGKTAYNQGTAAGTNAIVAPPDFSTSGTNLRRRQKAVSHGNSGTNDIITLFSPGSAAGTGTLTPAGIATLESWFYQTGAEDGAIWGRSAHGTWLAAVAADQLYLFKSGIGGTPVTPSHSITLNRANARVIHPLDGNYAAVLHQANSPGSEAWLKVVKLDNNAVTIASQLEVSLGFEGTFMSGVSAMDSSGSLYILTTPYTLANGQPPLASEVFVFTAADLINTNGPRVSSRYKLNNFVGAGLAVSNGVVYALGALRKSSTVQQQAIIKVTDQSVAWESPFTTYSTNADNVICHYYQENPNEFFFLTRNHLANYDSMLRFRAGVVDEVWALPKVAAGSVDNFFPCFTANRFYYASRTDLVLYASNSVRGVLDSSGTEAVLELSAMGENTNLITKAPFSVTVEISEALSSSHVLEVRINDTSIGTMAAGDGTSKEFVITADLSAKAFTVKLVAARTVAFEGYVKRVLLRYIPTQFKLKAWSFAVRADRNLKRIDGTRETLTPAQILEAIEAAWASNVPVAMTDRDGSSYSYVLVTDYDDRMPLIHNDRNKQEHLIFVEVLQAVAE